MPVRVRKADVHTAMFSVSAEAAQRLIDYSGLQVCEFRPGRAVVTLMLARYFDGDLGRYNEFGTCVMVNPLGSSARGVKALADAAAFVHHLPVDQAFTLEAGRSIWGFPKIMADFVVRDSHPFRFELSEGGSLIAAMDFRSGLPVPSLRSRPGFSRPTPSPRVPPAKCLGRCECRGCTFGRAELTLRLGDHPYAAELASSDCPNVR